MTEATQTLDDQLEIAEMLREYAKPNADLGWDGHEMLRDNAEEVAGFLLERGVEVHRPTKALPTHARRISEELRAALDDTFDDGTSVIEYVLATNVELAARLRMLLTEAKARPTRAKVILFKSSGKYYTEERWRIPTREQVLGAGGMPGDAVIPYCMRFSPDFRRISGGGPVLIEAQEPWGYPHLLLAEED